MDIKANMDRIRTYAGSKSAEDLLGHIFIHKAEYGARLSEVYILARIGYGCDAGDNDLRLISLVDGNRFEDASVTLEDLAAGWIDVTDTMFLTSSEAEDAC